MIDKTTIPGVWIYPDGRQVCQNNPSGQNEYRTRRRIAWTLQNGICTICHKRMNWEQATTDHIKPRKMGGSERDDRQENLAAVHWWCNSAKGSRRIA